MAGAAPERTLVVTSFLTRGGKVLLLRRSDRVGTYRGRWAGVSGYLERQALLQARQEIREEVGLTPCQTALSGIGVPVPVDDAESGHRWLVFPFLFRVSAGARIRLDWESLESRWVRPAELAVLDTVPGLAQALAAVWPPWGSARLWAELAAIATDDVTGATELALRGLRAVRRLRGAARVRGLRALAALHPAMGIFPHLAARAVAGNLRASTLATELEQATHRSAGMAATALQDCRQVLTHSASRACEEALLSWGRGGRRVVVTESRPRGEGVALGRRLAAGGLRITLITDAQLGLWAARCDAVVVGADAITPDDHLVNKAGTRLAALAAREAGTPIYAVTQTYKVCPPGWPAALAPQDPGALRPPPGLRASNLPFDATPLGWFRAVFTEQGPLSAELLQRLRQDLAEAAQQLFATQVGNAR